MNRPCSAIALLAGSGFAPAGELTFTNVTSQAGVAVAHANLGTGSRGLHLAGGGAVGDFNNDGWMDLYFVSGGLNHDNLFINNADGTFTDRAAEWGIHDLPRHIGIGAVAADFNADGFTDVYITSLGTPGTGGQVGRHRLLLNLGPIKNGPHRFQEAALAAGVNATALIIPDGFGAAAGDYDLDGDLDLAVAGWFPFGHNFLFRNDGNDTDGLPHFSNASANIASPFSTPFGLSNHGFSPRFVDTNGDWYPEIHWVSDFHTSRYLRNDTDGTFTDLTPFTGMGLDDNGMGNTHGDFDNDGDEDWYVSSIFQPGFHKPRTGNKLYINDGDDRFTETAEAAGAHLGAWGWGVSAVDLDHDGDLDIAEANGWHDFKIFSDVPAKLFINHGDATFTEAAAQHGMDHVGDSRGLARLDYDNDGDQDIAIFNHHGPFALLRNDLVTPGNQPADANWLRVLIDTQARPDLAPHGSGARVTATTSLGTQTRTLDIGPSYLVNDEPSAHFGLGTANVISRLEIRFHDGTTLAWTDLPANQTLHVLTPACRIDYAPPFDLLDLADITAFVTYFHQQHPGADIAQPAGLLDLADLTTFIQLFLNGCQ